MKITEYSTCEVKVCIGSREGYDGQFFGQQTITKAIQDYQKSTGKIISIRFSPCQYLTGEWQEEGWEITCISDPLNQQTTQQLEKWALGLAKYLLTDLKQERIQVIGFYNTKLVETDNPINPHSKS